jgi:ABC-type nitrate/sulfonate/bicarbonate transport system substrate-binding protein
MNDKLNRGLRSIPSNTMSRRRFLQWAGASAGAMAGLELLPGSVLAAVGDKPHNVKMIHAAPVPLVLWSVTYLAEDLGYYKEEGLTIERVPLANGPTSLAALLSGNGQGNLSTPGELLAAVAKGQDLRTIMSYGNRTAMTLLISKPLSDKLGVGPQSSLKEREAALKSIKGGRFGITTPGSLTDAFTRLALKQAGLDPVKDVQIVPMQSLSVAMAALQNNGIDAFMGLSPVTEQAIRELKALPLLAVATGEIREGAALQGQVLEVRASDIAAHPEVFAGMVRADTRALRYIIEKPDAARDLLRKTRFGSIREDIWPQIWQNQLPTWFSPYVTRNSLAGWIDHGLVADVRDSAKFPFEKVIDMRFVNDAVSSIGWKLPASAKTGSK